MWCNTDQSIVCVAFFDAKGKLAYKNLMVKEGKIATYDLKPGTYFMQVHFDGNIIKTLKAIKE
ncbi:MAG: T9SS type A sorting domain-containing protein [Bacteroidota bacterium]